MPKTIIVPLDGSDMALYAVPTASWLAESFGADLRLVTARFAREQLGSEQILNHARTFVDAESIQLDVLTGQAPSSSILEAARASSDPAICMSTRGHGGIGSMLLGRVSSEVVQQAALPVVLVGPRCRYVLDDPEDMVLCLTEPSERELMVPLAHRWATDLGLRLHVVEVLGPDDDAPSERAMFHSDEGAPAVGLTIEVREDAAEADKVTIGLAQGLDACLIMIGTDGHNRLLQGRSGHIATEIVRHSHCPVVVRNLRCTDR
jgi:nucleotide-binding universal stress UspA family protein